MTATEIKELVQSSLAERHDEGNTIRVVGLPKLTDGQWQILVEPTREEPKPRYRYYEILGEVEDELSDASGVSIFLMPAPEGTYDYKIGESVIEVKRRESSLYVAPKGSHYFFAVYDPNGRYESAGAGGNVSDADVSQLAQVIEEWRLRFDQAVSKYISERSQVAG